MTEPPLRPRLDKWLWAARFFKTRALASQAADRGRVRVNGERVKSSRAVNVGDRLEVRTGADVIEVEVAGLSRQRGPAAVAQALYQETEASRNRRQAAAEQRRLLASEVPRPAARPDKRARRQISRFRDSASG
jgi:ribosome-associated heat shock protein Hsp15